MRRKLPDDVCKKMKKKWIQFRRANQNEIYAHVTQYTHTSVCFNKFVLISKQFCVIRA